VNAGCTTTGCVRGPALRPFVQDALDAMVSGLL
jgi:hypothetical protein